jgi:hypothetical protein
MKINLEQYVEAKRSLERDLAALIQEEINKFETITGQSPYRLSVNMVSLISLGDSKPKYLVASVDADV